MAPKQNKDDHYTWHVTLVLENSNYSHNTIHKNTLKQCFFILEDTYALSEDLAKS
jgi:hypothetical protein